MNRFWLGVLLLLGSKTAVGEELSELAYHEDATLAAKVHVAQQPDEQQLSVYLGIDNQFKNTIECGGQLLAEVEKDGRVINLLVRFGNLRVLPTRAFPYPLVHQVGGKMELPPGHVFVVREYPEIKVSCRGWDYHQYLHPEFCQQQRTLHVEMCSGDKVSYAYRRDNFWLGLCQC